MTTLLFIRHGQSTSNISETFTGQLDTPLSALGHRQAAQTAKYILEHYRVDAVYASDLSRALDTGKAVADPLGLQVRTHPGLREIYGGAWEGTPFAQLSGLYPESYAGVWRKNIGLGVCDGGESVAQMQSRCAAAVEEILQENRDHTVVIATHATPIRCLQCLYRGLPLSAMQDIPWVTNASVTVFTWENGVFTEALTSYDAHLGDAITALPKSV